MFFLPPLLTAADNGGTIAGVAAEEGLVTWANSSTTNSGIPSSATPPQAWLRGRLIGRGPQLVTPPCAVQDHLKSLFGEFGVRSRAELVTKLS